MFSCWSCVFKPFLQFLVCRCLTTPFLFAPCAVSKDFDLIALKLFCVSCTPAVVTDQHGPSRQTSFLCVQRHIFLYFFQFALHYLPMTLPPLDVSYFSPSEPQLLPHLIPLCFPSCCRVLVGLPPVLSSSCWLACCINSHCPRCFGQLLPQAQQLKGTPTLEWEVSGLSFTAGSWICA